MSRTIDFKGYKYLIWGIGYIVLAGVISFTVPVGWDFRTFFLPAGQAILAGRSPYTVSGFYNPPWLSILFVPLVLLPEHLAWGLYLALNIYAYVIGLIRLRFRLAGILLVMLSPYVFYSLWYGNVDGLIILGATLPPGVGVWLILLKPQMSLILIGLWFYQSRLQGWKIRMRDFGLACLVFLVSWLVGLRPDLNMSQVSWNITAWPWGVLPGLALASLSLSQDSVHLALAASPFFSPYSSPQSWVVTLLPVGRNLAVLLFGALLGWVFVVLRATLGAKALIYEPYLLVAWGVMICFHALAQRLNDEFSQEQRST